MPAACRERGRRVKAVGDSVNARGKTAKGTRMRQERTGGKGEGAAIAAAGKSLTVTQQPYAGRSEYRGSDGELSVGRTERRRAVPSRDARGEWRGARLRVTKAKGLRRALKRSR